MNSSLLAASRDAEVATIRTALGAELPDQLGVIGQRRAVRASACGESGRCGRPPRPAVRPASRGAHRPARPARRQRSAISSRIELVPQSMPATRVIARRPAAAGRSTHGPAAHQSGSSASASSPSGFTPGRRRAMCPTSTCRHFTRSGMPPAEMPSISGTVPCSARAAQVVLVGGAVAARPAPGRRPAARSSRASARRPPAGRSPRPPAGRSGSTGSGTGCRPAAAGAVSTTSGFPHGQRCATETDRPGRPAELLGHDRRSRAPIGLTVEASRTLGPQRRVPARRVRGPDHPLPGRSGLGGQRLALSRFSTCTACRPAGCTAAARGPAARGSRVVPQRGLLLQLGDLGGQLALLALGVGHRGPAVQVGLERRGQR